MSHYKSPSPPQEGEAALVTAVCRSLSVPEPRNSRLRPTETCYKTAVAQSVALGLIIPRVPTEAERSRLSGVTLDHLKAAACANSVGRAVAVHSET